MLGRCQSPGATRRGLPLSDTRQGAQTALQETGELMALLQEDRSPPLQQLRDLDGHLQRVSRQGALDATALAEVFANGVIITRRP